MVEIVGLPGFEWFIRLPRGEYGTGGKDRVVWLHCAISAGFRLKYTFRPEEEWRPPRKYKAGGKWNTFDITARATPARRSGGARYGFANYREENET